MLLEDNSLTKNGYDMGDNIVSHTDRWNMISGIFRDDNHIGAGDVREGEREIHVFAQIHCWPQGLNLLSVAFFVIDHFHPCSK